MLTAIRDVRHENEVAWIRSAGGILVHVTSPNEEPRDPSHRSEYLDYEALADFSIRNDGTLEQLGSKVEAMLDHAAAFNPIPLPAGINDV
jgi:hypothetical protein